MTLTFKLWFIDEETDDANAFNITRDIATGELFPRVGDTVFFDRPKIKDQHFVVSDVQYKYHADGTLDDILIVGESDEYYNRNHSLMGGVFNNIALDGLGDLAGDLEDIDLDEFGGDPEEGTKKIQI